MTETTIPVMPNSHRFFIEELATGCKTGKQLRMRLEVRGYTGTRKAFYHEIRQLKDFGFITARRIPRDPGEYRGSQAVYELTENGWDEVHVWRQYLEDREQADKEHKEWYERCILPFRDEDDLWDDDLDCDTI